MRSDRRSFIKFAGLACLGLGLKPAWENLVEARIVEAAPAVTLAQSQTRWAMAIDLPKCLAAGECTDCIAACHLTHNVPHFEDPKTEIKWLWRAEYESAFGEAAHQYTTESLRGAQVPVLCNHCDTPACVKVCPTQATWKRPDGIVMMDEHRCIGCRYCMVACPYGARSFNYQDPRKGLDMTKVSADFPTRTRGVVEKCNFCVERLAKGEAPACVEACKEKALVFGNIAAPESPIRLLLQQRVSFQRNPGFGTAPQVYYVV